MANKPQLTRTVDRSAVTGKFVTDTYAKSHPRTTVHERVPVVSTPSQTKKK